jgi:Spy/CpxP family protein refolding chaperone
MFAKLKELGLTPEQKEKIQAIRKSGKENMQKLREDAKSAHQKLAEAHKKDASKAELTQLFNTAQEKQQAVAKQRFSQAMEIRDVLTPEQRKKAGAMMGEFFEKRGGKGRHGSHGPDSDDEE